MDHKYLYPNESLMDLARRAKCAVDSNITDDLVGFMAVMHPEVPPEEVARLVRLKNSERR